ncbi:DUF4236 domain-containing protein [Egicoccus sp. AB-alg2]|uniref:DUF4236 domain-containing protein n=1 Tax=Egicoccus sp. AB-alg2 TaxID=3242693 RepID=UPI00359EACCD
MGFRFRRSMKMLPGVRLNVTHRGVGVRLGPRGAGVSFHSSGRGTRSVGLPGTGMYWREDFRWRPADGRGEASASAAAATGDGAARAARPAAEHRRAAAGGVVSAHEERENEDRVTALHVALDALANDDLMSAERLLRPLVETRWSSQERSVTVTVAPGVEVDLPAGTDAAMHMLVETLQAGGRLERALEVAEQLHPTDAAALSVAELLCELGRFAQLLEELDGLPRLEGDTGRLLDVYLAVAATATGELHAADERLRQVLAAGETAASVRVAALTCRLDLARRAGRDDLADACRRAIGRLDPDHPVLDSGPSASAGSQVVSVAAEQLAAAQARHDLLTEQVVERERQLAEDVSRLETFARRYLARVGGLLSAVADLRARLVEARAANAPHDELLQQQARAAREQARQHQDACRQTSEGGSPPPASEDLKRAYRQAARAMHPDLAQDEDDRARRTEHMARLNGAYAARDEDLLARVVADWRAGAAAPAATTSDRGQLCAEIARLERRLVQLDQEHDEIRARAMWALMVEVETAEAAGRDVLADLAEELTRERDELQDELLLMATL